MPPGDVQPEMVGPAGDVKGRGVPVEPATEPATAIKTVAEVEGRGSLCFWTRLLAP